MLSPTDIRLVQESFQQIKPRAPQAAELFYERLFELDPSVRTLFEGVDLDAQGRKLMTMIGIVVDHLHEPDELMPAVADLGRRHADYGVCEHHYDTFGAALLWALGRGWAGAAWDAAVERAWARIYASLATTMKAAAAQSLRRTG